MIKEKNVFFLVLASNRKYANCTILSLRKLFDEDQFQNWNANKPEEQLQDDYNGYNDFD